MKMKLLQDSLQKKGAKFEDETPLPKWLSLRMTAP